MSFFFHPEFPANFSYRTSSWHRLTRAETGDNLLTMNKDKTRPFDEWPERYDRWFTTPIGSLVRRYELELIMDLVKPKRGEVILDAGCGTGVFTMDILTSGARVVGLDISLPMLEQAEKKLKGLPFQIVLANMLNLPFPEGSFDKTISITALEFIEEAKQVVGELFRVTKKGGTIVVATLNSLSSWASRRIVEAKERRSIFEKAIFRSPDELRSLASVESAVKTAIHFEKEDDPENAVRIEQEGWRKDLKTGAFVAARWIKP